MHVKLLSSEASLSLNCGKCHSAVGLCPDPLGSLQRSPIAGLTDLLLRGGGSGELVSSFLTAHQHILGYLVPYNGQNVTKM